MQYINYTHIKIPQTCSSQEVSVMVNLNGLRNISFTMKCTIRNNDNKKDREKKAVQIPIRVIIKQIFHTRTGRVPT